MAISCSPKLLIADEPTTALDVTIQKQILDLLLEIQNKSNMGLILITHDIGVVAENRKQSYRAIQWTKNGRIGMCYPFLKTHKILTQKPYCLHYQKMHKGTDY